MLETLLRAALIGIGATILFDVWLLLLNRVLGTPLPNWGVVGRWLYGAVEGRVFNEGVANEPQRPYERLIGTLFHYAVGAAYGFIVVAICGTGWLAAPTFLPPLIISLAGIGANWLFMAPATGAGWFVSKTPKPNETRLHNIAAHTVFAIGLYGTALIIH